jgi:phosphoribosylaminoimidazole-succinocarboxamide synthase
VTLTDAPTLPGWRHVHSGKVRDLYVPDSADGDPTSDAASDGPRRLLMVASDRVSAYDWVLPTLIPDKGAILTALSLWWFDQLADLVPHHVLSTEVPDAVAGRAIVCEQMSMVPVECVARGYLAGSGVADYRRDGAVCGVVLPEGLRDGGRLPEPLFTPATKAPQGEHDQNVTFDDVVDRVGRDLAEQLRRVTLAVYQRGHAIAADRGILLADTKLEFGHRPDGTLVLADEVLTPDSSRYWPAAEWQPGRPPSSFDKQIVRDWLTSPESGWDRHGGGPPPPLPDAVVERTRARYLAVFERLTGQSWAQPGGR